MKPHYVLALATLIGFAVVSIASERTLDIADIPSPLSHRIKNIPPEWIKATHERRFRIAPLERELVEEPPALEAVRLPEGVEAFQFPIRPLAIVRLEDRHCWGVLLVSTDKTWLKIKFGSYVPVLNVCAKVGKDQ